MVMMAMAMAMMMFLMLIVGLGVRVGDGTFTIPVHLCKLVWNIYHGGPVEWRMSVEFSTFITVKMIPTMPVGSFYSFVTRRKFNMDAHTKDER